MNNSQWKKLLDLYNETMEMIEYYQDNKDDTNKDKYRSKLYMLENAIEIFIGRVVGIMRTQIFKGKDVITVIKVFNDDDWNDENIAVLYYPTLDMIEVRTK